MKNYLLSAAFLLTVQAGIAQTIDLTGKVNNSEGKPVAFAFIADKLSQNAAYTDSLGDFKLKATLASTLSISCPGYRDATVQIGNNTNLNVVLVAGSASANASEAAAQQNMDPMVDSHQPVVDNLGEIMTRKTVGATQGSPYLFDGWVHGYVVTNKNVLMQDPHSLFNYDKVNGKLLLTKDMRSAIAVNNEQIKEFTLFDHAAQPYVFEMMPAIDPKHYAILIYGGKGYKIYKTVETRFEKENYKDNGIVSSGHNYDEYIDRDTYYILKDNGTPQKFDLRKKSIKNAFAGQQEKVTKFMNEQSGSDIDDNYLKSLAGYLDK